MRAQHLVVPRRLPRSLALCLALCLGASGCFVERRGTAAADAGESDTGVGFDAGEADAALPDAALPDAALVDAALPDATLVDAARPDSGTVLEVPGPPGTPTFSSVAADRATVAWSAPTTGGPAASYDLELSADVLGSPGAFTVIGTGLSMRSFDDTGLSSGTGYWYRVRATNAAGAGLFSAPALMTTTAPRSVTRVQFEHADAWNPSVRLGAAPTAGNLLVAVAFHRTNDATPSIPGWVVHIDTHFKTDDNDRRGLAILTRVAQPGDSRDVQITWTGGGRTTQLIVQELTAGPGASWTFEAEVSGDSGDRTVRSIAVTSASVPPADLLLIGGAGARDGLGSTAAFTGLGNVLSYSDYRSVASGFALVSAGGAQTTTASWTSSRRATVGLVVFRVD